MEAEINPFDLLSGKVVQNSKGTFWFKEPGHNLDRNGDPEWYYLHSTNNRPSAIWNNGDMWWVIDGRSHRLDGPAIVWASGDKEWWLNGKEYTESEFNEYVRNKPI